MRQLWLFFFLAHSTLAATYTPEELIRLREERAKLSTINQFNETKAFTEESRSQVVAAITASDSEVRKITGRTLDLIELDKVISAEEQKSGFSTFLVILVVLAGIILAIAIGGLVAYYLWPLLVSIPVIIYEGAAYGLSGVCMAAGYLFQPFDLWVINIQPFWFVIPGAISFAACIAFSHQKHWASEYQGESVYAGPGFFSFPVILSGLCCIAWGAMAIFYHNLFPQAGIPYFLAFISVIALESFLGFSVITAPGCIMLGWNSDGVIPRTTSASFLILAFYVTAHLTGLSLDPAVKLFETGGLFMGAFVYYLGLLVMSSKFYPESEDRYVFMQLLTIVSGLAAFFIGSTFGVNILLGVGGTFFTIYLLEKYYEIPWSGVGWFWSLLGAALAIYFIVGFAAQHPSYFLWTTPFLN